MSYKIDGYIESRIYTKMPVSQNNLFINSILCNKKECCQTLLINGE